MQKPLVILTLLAGCAVSDELESIESEVVLGTIEGNHQFPWVVTVTGTLSCHGTLIAPRWVVTAAHCVVNSYGGARVRYTRTDPSTGVVTAGEQQTGVKSVFVHPDYDAHNIVQDIALVRLPAAFPEDRWLAPAELPLWGGSVGQSGVVASTIHHTPPSTPPGTVAVLRGQITIDFGSGFEGRSPNAAVCPGDSGSGFIVNAGGRNFVLGVVTAANFNDCDDANLPFRAEQVYAYMDWISSVTGIERPAPDAQQDLLWRNGTSLTIWQMNANGGIASYAYPPSIDAAWVYQGTGDFDRDGRSDIVWRHSSTGGIAIWRMNGGVVVVYANPGYATLDWKLRGIGDTNGDGVDDLVWHNTSSRAISIWMMNSDGGIQSYGYPPATEPGWELQGVADFDGDGREDLFWRNNTSLAIWLMNGAAIRAYANPPPVALDWVVQGLGDFNADGHSDLVWRNTSTGNIAIWWMSGGSVLAYKNLAAPAAGFSIKAVGDITGDGVSDLVFRHSQTGNVAVWIMNPSGAVQWYANPGSATSAWTIQGLGTFN